MNKFGWISFRAADWISFWAAQSLVHVHPLAKHFRGRFLHLARRALPGVALPHIPWKKRWVVFAKPVVQGTEKTLDYLGRYERNHGRGRTNRAPHRAVRQGHCRLQLNGIPM